MGEAGKSPKPTRAHAPRIESEKIRSQKSGALFCHPSRSSPLRGHRKRSGDGAVLFLLLRRRGRTGFDHAEHADGDAACADGDAACADGALREDLGCGPRREREVVGLLALAATRCVRLSACWRSPLRGVKNSLNDGDTRAGITRPRVFITATWILVRLLRLLAAKRSYVGTAEGGVPRSREGSLNRLQASSSLWEMTDGEF